MTKSIHLRGTPRLTATALAAALCMAIAGAPAQAADRDQAAARALASVKAFPQRTFDGPGDSYEVRDVMFDADGAEHVRLARRYHGLRVIGGDLVVHSDRNGAFMSASHTLTREAKVDRSARFGAAQARAAAEARFPGLTPSAAPELVVYARGEHARLAWDVALSGEQADQTPSELHAIVDALDGTVLDSWDNINTAPAAGTGNSLFLGTVTLTTESTSTGFSLQDTTRGGSKTLDMMNRGFGSGKLFTDADDTWGDGTTANRQTAAVDAAYGAALTWDYYKSVHGRNGIANDGKGANTRVHYKKNYANAFWDDGCFCMTYGDGNASIYPLVSIDIAGHEMSHGVTSRTAGLIYSGESGGLNEGTSDIFGTMVEFYANNTNDTPDYLIGEEIFKTPGGSIRNMVQPSTDGASSDCWYSSVGSLDVHYSSGVANHFFYLLAQGTTAGSPSKTCVAGNTRVATGNGTVTGIGHAKAEKIWYRALTLYMTSSTNFAAARAATISAANDLYGAGSAESNAVAAAWTAVNRP